MKRRNSFNLLIFSAVIILVGLFNTKALNNNKSEEFSSVDPNKIPEILDMISNRTKSNYEQIKRWQGKLEIVTDYIYDGDIAKEVFTKNLKASGDIPNELLEHRETNIEFSLDAENELLYAEYYNDSTKPLKYVDLESGRDLEAKGILATRKAIITPEYQIDCITDTIKDGVVKRRKAIKQAGMKNSSTCEEISVYDPRSSLSIGDHIWEFLPRLTEHIKEHGKYSVGGLDLRVEKRKAGDANDFRIIIPSMIKGDNNFISHKMEFSGDNGFNVVLLETSYQKEKDANSIVFMKIIMEYQRFGEVYVPYRRLEQSFDVPSGKLKKEMTINFKNQKINESIPAETFTYKNLGLCDGDKFVDNIEGREYIYQDANLVPVEDVEK